MMFCLENALCLLLDGETSWMGQDATGGKVKEQSGKMGQGEGVAADVGKQRLRVSHVCRHCCLLQSAEAPVSGFASWGDFQEVSEGSKC